MNPRLIHRFGLGGLKFRKGVDHGSIQFLKILTLMIHYS